MITTIALSPFWALITPFGHIRRFSKSNVAEVHQKLRVVKKTRSEEQWYIESMEQTICLHNSGEVVPQKLPTIVWSTYQVRRRV